MNPKELSPQVQPEIDLHSAESVGADWIRASLQADAAALQAELQAASQADPFIQGVLMALPARTQAVASGSTIGSASATPAVGKRLRKAQLRREESLSQSLSWLLLLALGAAGCLLAGLCFGWMGMGIQVAEMGLPDEDAILLAIWTCLGLVLWWTRSLGGQLLGQDGLARPLVAGEALLGERLLASALRA